MTNLNATEDGKPWKSIIEKAKTFTFEVVVLQDDDWHKVERRHFEQTSDRRNSSWTADEQHNHTVANTKTCFSTLNSCRTHRASHGTTSSNT